MAVHLDTNVLLWLSQGRLSTLGDDALRLARRHPWIISPVVLLELGILHEIKCIRATPEQVLVAAREVGDLTISTANFEQVVQASRNLSWTRDPVDRLIVAQAIADASKLLTADAVMRTHFKDAVWD